MKLRIVEKCKEKAQEHGCKMLELGVWGFNEDAVAFYKSCGMTERARRMEYSLDD